MEELKILRSNFIEENISELDLPNRSRDRRRSSSLSQLSQQNPTNRRKEPEMNEPEIDNLNQLVQQNLEQIDQDLINDTADFDEFFKDLKKLKVNIFI